jgi:3-oxoacyl-(acyl-carrier-protein) synthase/SAM-dependent methyltransferase
MFLVPATQVATAQRLREWFAGEHVFALDPESVESLPVAIEKSQVERLVLVSVTPWRDGANDRAVVAFLRAIKSLSKFPRLRLAVIACDAIASPATNAVIHPFDAVFIGIGQTLAREFEEWDVACVSLTAFTGDRLRTALDADLSACAGMPVVIDGDRAWTAVMAPVALDASRTAPGFRHGGVYLIIGANGGIGGALARHLASEYAARLILAGRKPRADALVAELIALGGQAVYESLDVADADRVRELFERHPDIRGVVHSALALEDASLANMSEQSLMNVLRPKVHGAINLAQAIRGRDMDFVLMFSSIQSYIANAGQANYTAACVGKDAIAALMRDAYAIDARIINWGFWGSIGIVASEVYRERMRKLEIGSIEPEEGIAIVERLLRSDVAQITVVKASDAALRRLRIEPHPAVCRPVDGASCGGVEEILARVVPGFDGSSPRVSYNIQASAALQRYAAARLSQVPMPAVVVDKHAKLAAAIATIRGGDGPSRKQMLADFPEMAGHVNLLEICLDQYPGILSGDVDPLTVMFPQGSFELVEPVYRDNPLADYFNNAVAEVVSRYVEMRGDRPLRVLEIGAGTGSTAQFVLPVLRDRNATYVFTDLSFAFLNKARRRFAEFPFVRYEIFNVEKPPTNDELFDIVVATNVIHATADLPRVVRNVRDRIAPGGIFVLNEITSLQDYATLTFGLTEGWWLSTDPYRIPDSPLVSGDNWRRLLLGAGFDATRYHGTEDQQVVVAIVAEPVTAPVASAAVPPVSAADTQSVRDAAASVGAAPDEPAVQRYIRRNIAAVMHADETDIDVDQPFNEYGIDSLIALELLKPFRADLGYLPATVLFEHPTVARLAKHFIVEFGEKAMAAAGVVASEPAKAPVHASAQGATIATTAVATAIDTETAVRHLLNSVIADTMLLEVDDIDDDAPFMEYGIDSIISLELLKPLRSIFGYLPATLLFEHSSVSRLARHLAAEYPDASAGLVGADQTPTASQPVSPTASSVRPSSPMAQTRLSPRSDDIAIVGMAGRFPEAGDIDAFWRNLLEGRDSTVPVPDQRWPQRGALAANAGHYTNVGAFLDDVDAFDHQFFGVTPLEAERMDPQERLFLQTAYHAIEDAAIPRNALRGTETGVFVGVMNGGYAWHRPKTPEEATPTSLFWSIANRVSYLFDLKGPSMAVDTACSSSMTALHLACQALRDGDCDTAFIGGVNLITHPRQYDLLCGMHMLSRSGACKPFGEHADGFVDGEGICCLVAKRHADAVRDGDRILGVVRGSAINAGGQSNGYSAPNPESQAKVVAKAIERAGVNPADIAYIEAHGTGTELGDPIEIRGLCKVFADVPVQSIALGSVKGNIGHLESAAGLAGVVKVLLQMRHGRLVPSLHAERHNPHLRLDTTPFRLQRTPGPSPKDDAFVAGVSSYGAGGANAHVVLQAVPMSPQPAAAAGAYVATLSARTANGLQRRIDALRDWISANTADAERIAYTLCCGREHFSHRAAFVFDSVNALRDALATDLRDVLSAQKERPEAAVIEAAIEGASRREQASAKIIAEAYLAGADVSWSRIYTHRRPISLPGYAFEKQRFWVDSVEAGFHDRDDILRQHVINDTQIAPAAWALSHMIETTGASRLTSVLWRDAIRGIDAVSTQTEGVRFALRTPDHKQIYCEGEIGGAGPASAPWPQVRSSEVAERLEHDEIYRRFDALGYRYGRDLRSIRWARVDKTTVEASLEIGRNWGYRLSPALLDGGLQTAILLPSLQRRAAADEVLLPYHLGSIAVHRLPRSESVYCVCALSSEVSAGRSVVFDLRFFDERGETLIEMREMTSLIVKASALRQPMPAQRRNEVVVHDID